MKFSLPVSLAVLASFACALPEARPDVSIANVHINSALVESDLYARDDTGADGSRDGDGKHCLTAERAQQVADNFRNLIANYSNALANATLTTNYTDYSDSVNELIDGGCPNGPIKLGSPTFTNRATFESAQGSQPAIPFQQLNIWHTCHTVVIRWYSAQSPEIVTGIIVMETVPAPAGSKYKDLINLVFSEFNSGAWLYNLGIFKPTCSS